MSSTKKAWLFTGMAVATTLAACVGLQQLTDNYIAQLDQARQGPPTVFVAVAARELYQGIAIEQDDLYAIQVPTTYVPEGAFLTPEHLIGRIPRERILANELVRGQRLSDPESGVGLNATIPRGTRALSIEIADGAALAGLLHPSDYVDVLVTLTPDNDDRPEETRTLLQAVYVLGVNGRMRGETAEEAQERRGALKPTVTLLVTAAEAEQVAHAANQGDIHLSLRSGVDVSEHLEMGGATRCLLLGGCAEAVAPATRPMPAAVNPECVPLDKVEGSIKIIQWFDAAGLPCTP